MARGNSTTGGGQQRSLNALYTTAQKLTQQIERLMQTSGGGTAMAGGKPSAGKGGAKGGGGKKGGSGRYRGGQGQTTTE
jgi:hypothetical protein